MADRMIGLAELARVDLNRFVPFGALMAERNVTRATARIGLAQPSAGSALDRPRHPLATGSSCARREPCASRPDARARDRGPAEAAALPSGAT